MGKVRSWEVSDEFWGRVEPLIPARKRPREAIPPFASPGSPSAPPTPFILANVASRGARQEITAWLTALGYEMGVGAVAVG